LLHAHSFLHLIAFVSKPLACGSDLQIVYVPVRPQLCLIGRSNANTSLYGSKSWAIQSFIIGSRL